MATTWELARTVFVYDIALDASEAKVREVFAFSGNIEKLAIHETPAAYTDAQGGSQRALIQFSSLQAAQTALLLSKCLVHGRPIVVVRAENSHIPLFTSSPAASARAATAAAATAPGTPSTSSSSSPASSSASTSTSSSAPSSATRAATAATASGATSSAGLHTGPPTAGAPAAEEPSVVASLLATSWGMAVDLAEGVKRIDQDAQVTSTLSAGVETLTQTTRELDQSLGISERASAVGEAARQRWASLAESIGLNEKVEAARDVSGELAENATTQASALSKQVTENPTVASLTDSLRSWGSWASQSLTTAAAPLAETVAESTRKLNQDTERLILEQKRQRGMLDEQPASAPVTDDQLADYVLEPRPIPPPESAAAATAAATAAPIPLGAPPPATGSEDTSELVADPVKPRVPPSPTLSNQQ
eukprot:CAMPEP_0177651770 /NCGR_PEP_ID=MMETSP0447-20121125/12737_1 /TAXON_ID=0 /ORGANISM="Stygamoeba regulata, Strain BSH-02190019" /LENGTH=421 /DNA_ID=CAMNT_0019154897 /DNA_START=23 /DNA_END=1288 /DNA_ORIENTATION=+